MKLHPYVLTSFTSMDEQSSLERASIEAELGSDSIGELVTQIPENSLVIPRYRAIPFGDLLEREVEFNGSRLVNTFKQHRNIADSSNWSYLLDGSDGQESLTPRQYSIHDIPHLPEGEWFVKGETNSLKNQWLESSYAPTTKDLSRIVNNFLSDTYVGNQEVVIKPFQKYRKLTTALNGQPVFNERRVFVLNGSILVDGFYWSSWEDELGPVRYDKNTFITTAHAAINRVKHIANFMVVDLAEYSDGSWGVVELNDGSMSGLSSCDPNKLWRLFKTVNSFMDWK